MENQKRLFKKVQEIPADITKVIVNVTVQGKSKLMEGGTKLGFPLDCHIMGQTFLN